MDPSLHSVITFISASLAPAVLLTGVGLLLARLQTKYSTLVNVLRQLSGEARQKHLESTQDVCDRQEVLLSQMKSLVRRAKLVRNAICSFYVSIFLLVISSLSLGLNVLELPVPVAVIFTAFGAALLALFAGVAFASFEAVLSFQIVQMEARKWT